MVATSYSQDFDSCRYTRWSGASEAQGGDVSLIPKIGTANEGHIEDLKGTKISEKRSARKSGRQPELQGETRAVVRNGLVHPIRR